MTYPVFQPFLGPEELDACRAALDSKYLGMGSFVGEFEKALGEALELGTDRHLVTVSTGHAALHLAFLALGIGPGDEIITPSFNNIADFQAISAVGAEPVFCDVDPVSLCIDPAKIAGLIGPRTRAIIAMDYGAVLADHAGVAAVASAHGIPVIHDAAHSYGSRYQGKPIGHQAGFTMLSFDPIKNITCIDGGALIFDDPAQLEKLRAMRLIGMGQRVAASYSNKRDWGYDVERLGFRYHLANLHAAIGLSQMAKFDDIRSRRRTLYQTYFERLDGQPQIGTQGRLGDDIVPFILCIRVPADRRAGLKEHLRAHDIETGIHWKPGHLFSLYANCRAGDLSVTQRIGDEIVSLPFYPDLMVETVHFICDRILEFFATGPGR